MVELAALEGGWGILYHVRGSSESTRGASKGRRDGGEEGDEEGVRVSLSKGALAKAGIYRQREGQLIIHHHLRDH